MATPFIRVSGHADFADALNSILDQYALEVGGRLPEAMEETAKYLVKEIKSAAEMATNTDTGKRLGGSQYRKSWTYKRNNSNSLYKTRYVIHSKAPYYRLAHLLEYGHANRNGGRTAGYPHISKASDVAEQVLMTNIWRILRENAK